ncbi:hypothetical protein Bca4012_011019 [Brassica carinata]
MEKKQEEDIKELQTLLEGANKSLQAVDTCLLCNVKNGGELMDMDMLLIGEEEDRITNNDLEAADLDEDGVVGAAEFTVYKLKEMGKIDEKDISGIIEEFEQLDYDEFRILTTSDIVLAQTTSQIQR